MRAMSFKRMGSALYRWRWLLSRRVAQLIVVSAFLVNIGEKPVALGNLSSSVWFGWLPFTDPFVMLQSIVAGASFSVTALIGVAIIAGFYVLFGGRIYCAWVCPINMLTDFAFWLRQRLKIKRNVTMSRELRTFLLVISLILSAVTGSLAWEAINPITLFQRELMWMSTAGLTLLTVLFLFDLLVTRRGWCGHLCPVGKFYAILGRYGRVRVTAQEPGSCVGCSACIKACPEPHVLAPVISNVAASVTHGDCTRCGACLDTCDTGALAMKLDLNFGKSFRGIPIIKKAD